MGKPCRTRTGVVALHSKRKGQSDRAERFALTWGSAESSSSERIWKKRRRVKGNRRGCDLVEGAWFSAVIVLFFLYIYFLE